MTLRLCILALAIAFLPPVGASACRIGHVHPPPESLATGTSRIALAEVVEIDRLDRRVRYRFRAIEVLRGDVPATFTLDGDRWGESSQNDDDFHGHRPDGQRADTLTGGRTLEWPDCRIHPGFRKGFRYLVFLDALDNPWGSERITADRDLWLLRVRFLAARPTFECIDAVGHGATCGDPSAPHECVAGPCRADPWCFEVTDSRLHILRRVGCVPPVTRVKTP